MPSSKGGRPRGPNYEKNLQKRLRYQERRKILKAEPIQGSQSTEWKESRLYHLTKSLYGLINSEKYAGKKPVYSHQDVGLLNQGVILRSPYRPSYQDLRNASYSVSLLGAIHTIRTDDMGHFFGKEHFGFDMEDEEESSTDEDKELIKEAQKFFHFMGDKVEGWSTRDRLPAVGQMMIRDTLCIDKVAFELRKNSFGKLCEIKYLDPATIFRVDPEHGYKGDKTVTHVQIVDNKVVCTFGPGEILVRHKNQLSDIRYRDTGLSPAEVCITELAGIINALKYNRERFSNNPPPGFMSVRGHVDEAVMERLNMQWNNLWSGNENNFEIPIIGSEEEIHWTPLNIQNDMAFDKLLQWLSTFALATHGMDQAELGLRLMGSQGLSEGSMDGRISHSMTRSKKAMLSFFSSVFNDIKEMVPKFEPITQVFWGIDEKDEDKEQDRRDKRVKSIQTIDEIRAELDLPTLGEEIRDRYGLDEEGYEKVKMAGAQILEPNWTQIGAQTVSGAAGGGSEQDSGAESGFEDW